MSDSFDAQNPADQSSPSTEAPHDHAATISRDDRTWRPDELPRIEGYEILGEIARGGMGVVYKAREVGLNRMVALKMILAGNVAGSDEVERFRAEAETAAGLSHPNVVPIYQVGTHEGVPFLTMKLIDGTAMSRAIPALTNQPRVVARLLAQIARAVHHAHQSGVLHRDLKPGNVLLDEQGTPHVTDFGLAKKVEDDRGLTQTGALLGTPSYMAPEQARAEKRLTTAADVYSLGAILYQCLTGRPPFQGASAMDTALQVIQSEPTPPRQLNPKADRDLVTICLKCLDKEPQRRYGSAEALAEDLERWLDGKPIHARAVGSLERAAKWCRRRPALAALLALVVLVSVSAASVVTWKWLEAEEAAAEKERQRAQAVRALYFSRVNLAHAEYERGTIVRMEELLESCPPRHVGWEWHFLKHLLRQEVKTLTCGPWQTAWVAWSPDRKYLATSSIDGGVQLWHAETFQPVKRLQAEWPIVGAAFSPDGKLLAAASGQWKNSVRGKVIVWDVETAKQLPEFDGHGHTACVTCVAFSPDGKLLASGSGSPEYPPKPGELIVRDAETGRIHWREPKLDKGIAGVVFHPGGEVLAAWGGNRLLLRSAKTGKKLPGSPDLAEKMTGGLISVNAIAFSDDGARIAVAGRTGNVYATRIYETASGAFLFPVPGGGQGIDGMAFDRAGRFYWASADQTIRRYDLGTGETASWRHRNWVWRCAVDPDGKRLASASVDGQVKVWDLNRPTDGSFSLHHEKGKRLRIACSSDNSWVASAGAGTVRLWRRDVWRKAYDLDCPTDAVPTLAFSGDGLLLAAGVGNGSVRLWKAGSEEEMLTYEAHNTPLTRLCLDRKGELLATAVEDGSIKLWRLNGGNKPVEIRGPWQDVMRRKPPQDGLALSADGRFLAATAQGRFHVWDVATGQPQDFPATEALRAAFGGHGDKEMLAVGSENNVRVWDRLPDGGWDVSRPPRLTLRGHNNGCRAIAFSPDGTRIATSDHEGVLRLWDASGGETALIMRVPEAGVDATLAFTGDSRGLIVAHRDSIRVWDVPLSPLP